MGMMDFGETFLWTDTGLEVKGKPTLEQCAEFGKELPKIEKSASFVAGDFINYVEDTFGEEASQIIDAAGGWSEGTVRNYSWVCKCVPREVRRPELSFKHHRLVAKLDRKGQVKWLKRAADGEDGKPWTIARLASTLRKGVELETTGWLLLVDCGSAQRRAEVEEMLAGKVAELRPIDRHTVKREKKEEKKEKGAAA